MKSFRPTGTVTFLFTDIEGSTQRWEKFPDAMERAHRRQEQIIRDAVARHNGYAYKMIGDAFQVAFVTARDALDAAIDAQSALSRGEAFAATRLYEEQNADRPTKIPKDHDLANASPLQPVQIRVRMALHTGVTEERGDDYVGSVLNRVARLMTAGHGGQILISDATEALLRDHLPANVSLRDMGERRLKDLTRAEHVYQVVAPDLPSEFPPLKTLDAFPNNLPIQLTSFIGREKEIEEIKRLLTTARLVTLTGAGGCGKTRLALEIAADVGWGESPTRLYKDGAWFIELAPLSDPALVPNVVASVLGVREEQGRTLTATLMDYFRDKQLLLVLDNCEHLIDTCAQFTDGVLHAGRETRILASSREALGIAGESTFRVPSLTLPDAKNLPPIETLSQYEAVRLFIDRAVTVQKNFQVTNANAPAVAQICHRLDGIPLAIELAAARVKALPVEKIAERLDDRFRLLTGGSRTALPRQQTLRSMIDWSFSLLSEPERVLLRRLSVFAGGWTLEAAEEICAGEQASAGAEEKNSPLHPSTSAPLLREDVLDLLTRLVDKSLVVLDEQAQEPRYYFLETVRQYAREKLLDANESERLRDQHLDFFLKLAEYTEPMFRSGERLEWIARFEVELDNWRAALEWACERDPETARWLMGVLRSFWTWGDHLSEARTWYARVLALDDLTKTRGCANALLGAGLVSGTLFLQEEALSLLGQSTITWRELGDERRLAESLFWLAYSTRSLGHDAEACTIFEENEALIRKSADRFILAATLTYWGRAIANARHDYAAAKVLHQESIAVGQELKDLFGLGVSFMNLGYMALQQRDYEAARQYHLESLALRRKEGGKLQIAISLREVASIMSLQGDYEDAKPLYEEALSLYRSMGGQVGAAWIKNRLGYVAVHQRQFDKAMLLFAEWLEMRREGANQFGIAMSLSAYAELRRAQGQTERAVQLLAQVETLLESSKRKFHDLERVEYERSVVAARTQLDEATFNAAWNEGRAMTMEQAIELAMKSDSG